MSNDKTILLGAVAYDPKVVTIWEGIREHFLEQGVPLDFCPLLKLRTSGRRTAEGPHRYCLEHAARSRAGATTYGQSLG
ncbi:MAG TPA: hypothetical protein VE135_20300 [Pyrinomonadaceae bacterium]|nr:hypothetical protein [Pyrinomonadaceae bacterium]